MTDDARNPDPDTSLDDALEAAEQVPHAADAPEAGDDDAQEAPESAADAPETPEPTDEADDDADAPAKPKGGFSKRLSAIEEALKAERLAAIVADTVRQMQAQPPAPGVQPPPVAPAPWVAPPVGVMSYDEFCAVAEQQGAPVPDYDQYTDYRAEMLYEQREQQRQQREAQAAEQTAKATHWQATLSEAKATHPDFDAVVGQAEVAIHPQVMAACNAMPPGSVPWGEVQYYLATHPDEVARLNACRSRDEVALVVGELKAEVRRAQSATAPASLAQPGAQPPVVREPVQPLSGGRASADRRTLDTIDDPDEWIEARMRGLREAARRRTG